MDVIQSNDGNIPEEKDKKEENDTGQDEQSNKDPFLRPVLQYHPLKIQISNSEVQMNQLAPPWTICILTNLLFVNQVQDMFPLNFSVICLHELGLKLNPAVTGIFLKSYMENTFLKSLPTSLYEREV